ncbi:MAG: serine/threonine-protein phosphatase, partial [Clostridia bacterium]|nr:serine/threonine-protein phosphatase [Clostridia bacterium]
NGRYLEEVNNGLPGIYTNILYCGDNPTLAVFDGMGGEQKGEVASYIASSVYNGICKDNKELKNTVFLVNTARKINNEICRYGSENGIPNVGCTGAFIAFSKKKIYIANIGDSPILRLSSGELKKISVDHVLMPQKKKSPLTQYLGVPPKEFIIEPHRAEYLPLSGDRYLLCSDGVTDMIEKSEIKRMMSETEDIGEAAKVLLETALKNGGKDNTTLILCEIKKVKIFGKIDL